jgi:hypothetical protein
MFPIMCGQINLHRHALWRVYNILYLVMRMFT